MSITKTIRLSGTSDRGIEAAIKTVLARAAETIAEITRFEVVSVSGNVDSSGAPTGYHVDLDITFVVRETTHN